ncbi:MAG: fumarylacetoacetate hydrolase family protein [Pseudomonadota bacterium]|nr:fumarylacetoacetate hydrolase family protein [Pseudomonadota bacterium]
MRLVTFTENNHTRIGIDSGTGIIDLSKANPDLPEQMTAFLSLGDEAMEAAAHHADREADFALTEVRLESPVLRPGKILAIGLNYRAHAEESGMDIPKTPLVFTKQNTSINGPYDPVHKSNHARMLDYEGELAVVIGKKCRYVPKEKAAQVVAGYSVSNDVSVREWQMRGTPAQFTMGKSWDTHCPLGPAIVTDIDPHVLNLTTQVNGEVRQDTNTNDLIFDCFDIIEYLTTAFTLEPGDVIVTGTPSGVGMAMKPPSPLEVGDVVRIEIEGLGHIENEVVAEPDLAFR